jgi:tetratricopeptide (TPR) repeat protein
MIDLAQRVESQICVDRLLDHLFPNAPSVADRPGRHAVLTELVLDNPRLYLALLREEHQAVHDAWSTCLGEHDTDLRLLHTLAVLYRERALANPDQERLLIAATALWGLLLSTPEFWATASTRVVDQQAELVDTVAGELFGLHASAGRHALTEGRDALAQQHLGCLVAGRSGELAELLMEFDILYVPSIDEQLMRRVSGLAAGLLDDWSNDLIRAAEKAVEDPVAIAALPSGISKNWSGGVEVLRPLVRIGAPLSRVLRVALDWYVDWCYALVPNKDFDGIEELLKSARQFADQLVPLAERGQGHQPENQALSRYHMFLGYVATKVDVSKTQYRLALDWDPYNDEAQNLLDKSAVEEVLDRGFAAFKNKDYTEALEHLRAALTLADPARQAKIRENIADVHNARGVDVIDRANVAIDKFGAALTEVLSMVKVWLSLGKTALAARSGSEPDWLKALPGWTSGSTACPVCTKPEVTNPGEVVTTIVADVRRDGKFEATSSIGFWRRFEHLLCANCKSSLEFCAQANHIAARHFTEAVRMDPNHPSAKANLGKVQ